VIAVWLTCVDAQTTSAELPVGTQAAYLNVTALLPPDAKLTSGSHDMPSVIRSARISQKERAMILVMQRNVSATVVRIGIEAELVLADHRGWLDHADSVLCSCRRVV
jgi:hypothetical protein